MSVHLCDLGFFFSSNNDTELFESCLMYDFSGQAQPDNDFETALKNRMALGLSKVGCDSSSAPENERYQYDMSEGLDTIVNNVRSHPKMFMSSLFKCIFFSGTWSVIACLCSPPFKAVTWVEFSWAVSSLAGPRIVLAAG